MADSWLGHPPLMHPQLWIGGVGLADPQPTCWKLTVYQFVPSLTPLKKVLYWSVLMASTAMSKCHVWPMSFV